MVAQEAWTVAERYHTQGRQEVNWPDDEKRKTTMTLDQKKIYSNSRRLLRDIRRVEGKCTTCPNVYNPRNAVEGKRMCARCAKRIRLYMRDRLKRLRNCGQCPKCERQKKENDNHYYCAECRKAHAAYAKKHRTAKALKSIKGQGK